jgi:ATP-dependent Clp protease ATP-binding subunit ClpC
MARRTSAIKVLEDWTERDLSAALEQGDLAPAFAVDEQIAMASDALLSGRNLMVSGEAGIGKTALIRELVRRAARDGEPAALAGRRVLQFSFRHRAATLHKPEMLLPETQRLIEVLLDAKGQIVPFFRDFHRAYYFDVEAQLLSLGHRLTAPILGEGEPNALSSLFEYMPELEQQYAQLHLEEPDFARTALILEQWAAYGASRTGRRFTSDALDEALHLSHRFLARNRMPRKALDLLVQVESLTGGRREITRGDVIERFVKTHHVPHAMVDPAVPLDLEALEAQLGQTLLGQAEAVGALARMIGLIKSGLSDTRRPFGVFLFAGPTGVGKTHAAQLLAQRLFGSRERMVRLNMADFQTNTAPAVLFGDPGGSKLSERRGTLTQRVAGHPFAVLLLDEFEKAHEKIADQFLQLFDEGAFINGNGETVACRSMIIIATSNVGAELYREQAAGFASQDLARLQHELQRKLAQRFRIELLNRFDQVVHFKPLSRADVRIIAARELQSLKERIGFKRSGMELDIDESVLDWLAVHGYDPRFGARFLRRALEREVTSAVASLLVRGTLPAGTRGLVTVRRDRVEARLIAAEDGSPSKKELVTLPSGSGARSAESPRAGARTKSLDRESLRRTAADLLTAAAGLRTALGVKRDEASRLLDALNAPGFWDAADSRNTLERYRSLDVAIEVESRFARTLDDLDRLMQETSPWRDLARAARIVEAAARALHGWQARAADESARELWLLISRADPMQSAESWLIELAKMELAWCRRVHLHAAIVAAEAAEGEWSRIILHVEGPGAASYLAMEEGLHRLVQKSGPDLKARVDLLSRETGAAAEAVAAADATDAAREPAFRIAPIKTRSGPLDVEMTCSGRLEMDSHGVVIDLIGADPRTLAALLADLEAHRRGGTDDRDRAAVSRIYGKDGVAARDPRTGATMARPKDVRKGELDPFLDAWRARAVPA